MNCDKEKAVHTGLRNTLLDARACLAMAGRGLALIERVAADGGNAPARVFAQMQLECMARRAADMAADTRAAYAVLEDDYRDTAQKVLSCAVKSDKPDGNKKDFTNSGKERGR